MFDYINAKEAAEKSGISQRRVQLLCVQGRIPGAMKYASDWNIPRAAVKLKNERVIIGMYLN
ncbi:MAG TPA: DNA-binding protein [Lachnospiraceae bacterium]|nr:DNA-binding protein [Lachnospiraceae bacterium]